jgi:hypothetical protein
VSKSAAYLLASFDAPRGAATYAARAAFALVASRRGGVSSPRELARECSRAVESLLVARSDGRDVAIDDVETIADLALDAADLLAADPVAA